MSDSTYKKVKEYLVQKGYHAVPDETYDHIDEYGDANNINSLTVTIHGNGRPAIGTTA